MLTRANTIFRAPASSPPHNEDVKYEDVRCEDIWSQLLFLGKTNSEAPSGKNTMLRIPASHAILTELKRFAPQSGKHASSNVRANTTWQPPYSHPTAICKAEHHRRGTNCRTKRAQPQPSHRGAAFIAGSSHFTRENNVSLSGIPSTSPPLHQVTTSYDSTSQSHRFHRLSLP